MSEYLDWYKSTVGHSRMKKQAKNEIEQLTEQLEKANERIEELENKLSALSYCIKNEISSFYDARNYEDAVEAALVELKKFSIEKKIEALESVREYAISQYPNGAIHSISERIEQLRKEQE